MNPVEFAAKWSGSTRTERAAAQEHFIDLCRMLGQPTPNEADPSGAEYAFEKGAEKVAGGDGFADVWRKGRFAWEYKGKRKNLDAAYQQLLQYREALENPPLLVVCDLNRFEVHTNFTGTAKRIYRFTLADLASQSEEPLRILRAVMTGPDALKPSITREQLTEDAAEKFAQLATTLRGRGHDPHRVAHFLNKLLFCMFAEDVGLLPAGLIERLASNTARSPEVFSTGLKDLFGKMAKSGGLFGVERIEWFNGGLFDGDEVVELTREDIEVVRGVARLDWSDVEPAIFGALFERGLDPHSRTSLGAHYTDRASIEQIVEPVVIAPLRREFDDVRAKIEALELKSKKGVAATNAQKKAERILSAFLDRLATVTVLDPACGSGNFLYVTLQALKDLEHRALIWGLSAIGRTGQLPRVGPQVVHGIEINDYAAELARVTIWIGEIQWMLDHGYGYRTNPVLQPLESIECRDALLDLSNPLLPVEATWPTAEFIVGNPPFLGNRLLRRALGSQYVEILFRIFAKRIPASSDLVVYWFEKARDAVEHKRSSRVGLLSTQGIRGQANREVLRRIKATGDIFLAWSDQAWVLDGATVRIALIGFDGGEETSRSLDGEVVDDINIDLTSGADVTEARPLEENRDTAFYADVKSGPFDLSGAEAAEMLASPNPHGRSNRDVVRPWSIGRDILGRPRGRWIVDFGSDMPLAEACQYEAPFRYVKEHVYPKRKDLRREAYKEKWWLHAEPSQSMRNAIERLPRYIVTIGTSKHRVFAWLPPEVLPDHALIAVARADDYAFGVLQSAVHERWALQQGTQLESRPRYTPTTCFETFPFPPLSGGLAGPATPAMRILADEIARAAVELIRLRDGWLNPTRPDGTPALSGADIARRTLTNLYNERPEWLERAHLNLDQAVLAAYGWPTEWAEALQPARNGKNECDPALGVRVPSIEQELLGRLLAMNKAMVPRL